MNLNKVTKFGVIMSNYQVRGMTEAETAEFNEWLRDGYNTMEREAMMVFDEEGTVARFREEWRLAKDESHAFIRHALTMKIDDDSRAKDAE
jgi:hypothetical protein